MMEILYLFMIAAAMAVGLGFLVVWSRRGLMPRLAAVGLSMGLIALIGLGVGDLLGRPKPVRMEWADRHADEAQILAARMVEGDRIYLWLGLPGKPEPRSYVIPWSLQTAKDLQKAMEEAAKTGSQVRARLPFESSWDERGAKFYALPQPKGPDKPAPAPPLHFTQPGSSA